MGDISAVDINNGDLQWQLPTQSNVVIESAFSLETSDIITDGLTLFFSNNSPLAFSMGKELSGSVGTPLLNPFICSGIAPTAEAITGKPQDRASDIAKPQVSIFDDCM